MVRYYSHWHLRGPRRRMFGYTSHVVSALSFVANKWRSCVCVLKGYLVSERAGVRGGFWGIRSNAVQEWNVRGLIRSIYPCH